MSCDDRARWESTHAESVDGAPPASFLMEHSSLLVAGRTLDLACGRGRNAAFLAERGHQVVAVDIAPAALEATRRRALGILPVRMNLDDPGFRLASFDNVVCVSFLDRRLFPAIREWLRPGGVLVFDTFVVEQREIGHPRNPDYLLGPNELLERLAQGYRVLRYREGEVVERGARSYRAGVVARRTDP